MTRGPLAGRWWLAGAFGGLAFGLVDGLLAYAPSGPPSDDLSSLLGVASSVALWAIVGASVAAVVARFLRPRAGNAAHGGSLSTAQWLWFLVAGGLAMSAIASMVLRLVASASGESMSPSARTAVALMATGGFGLAAIRLLERIALRRPGRVALWVGGLAVLLWVGLVARDVAAAHAPVGASAQLANAAAPPQGPNVVLVVLDTARADHMSAYGYSRPTTPFLEELAHDATLYENAVSPAPWTLPSHASLFTGQLPSIHGATAEHRWLRDEFSTLAELLQARGYATAGFTNNAVVSHATNMQRGFDQFTDVFLEWGPDMGWSGWTEGRRRTIPERLLHQVREWSHPADKGATRTNELVGSWLDGWKASSPRRPFFVFVNLLETHLPYAAPPPFEQRFVQGPIRPGIKGLTGEGWFHEAFRLIGQKDALNSDDYAQLQDLYDAEVAYEDARLRDLVEQLRSRGVLDDTLLVVVSDHGENLGDHGGLVNHVLSFHETLLHVPLIVRRPGHFPAGLRYAPPVSTVSIFATILDETRTPAPLNQTPAFGPLPRTAGDPAPAQVLSEYELPVFALAAIVDDVPGFNVGPLAVRQHAVRQGPWKLVRSLPGDTTLYDLAEDPREARPLAPDSAPEGRELASYLDQWEATLPTEGLPSTSHAVDAATRKALEGLGYVR